MLTLLTILVIGLILAVTLLALYVQALKTLVEETLKNNTGFQEQLTTQAKLERDSFVLLDKRTREHYAFLRVVNKRIWALYQAVHNKLVDDISRGVLDNQFSDSAPLFGKPEQPTDQQEETQPTKE